jgi:murein DD-endopeptidase MepM/ murein hydrolase activator NlpD
MPRPLLKRFTATTAALVLIAFGGLPVAAVSIPVPTPPPVGLPDPHLPPPILPAPIHTAPAPGPGVPSLKAPSVPGGPLSGTIGPPSGSPDSAGAPGSTPPQPYPGPPADEQSTLPSEPGRNDLESQQWDLAQAAYALDQEFADSALLAHGLTGRFVWPIVFRNRAPITQRFGCSDLAGEPYNAACASKRWHTGIDLGLSKGTPIFASETGVAYRRPGEKGYGNYVLINHGDGYYTLYAHLSDFAVQDRQIVQKGELIGLAGSTGYSTGPHLHFEIRHEADYLDPCAFLMGC